jgi:hypothetical protein
VLAKHTRSSFDELELAAEREVDHRGDSLLHNTRGEIVNLQLSDQTGMRVRSGNPVFGFEH